MQNPKCDTRLLELLGWRMGWQRFESCKICHVGGFDLFGWRSPNFAFYHDSCLLRSSRYAKILKRANKASTRRGAGGSRESKNTVAPRG